MYVEFCDIEFISYLCFRPKQSPNKFHHSAITGRCSGENKISLGNPSDFLLNKADGGLTYIYGESEKLHPASRLGVATFAATLKQLSTPSMSDVTGVPSDQLACDVRHATCDMRLSAADHYVQPRGTFQMYPGT